jgi:uncharacterized protein YndB with AHSA1/START domain
VTDRIHAFTVPPVVKTVTVRCPPERAFRAFTADLARWWPLAHFHIGAEPQACMLEGRPGGRIYERSANGVDSDWGKVTAWEPPHRLAFTWEVLLQGAQAQQIEVTFRAVDGGTEVRLVHSGWDALGPLAAERREQFDRGWVTVFEQAYRTFADAA